MGLTQPQDASQESPSHTACELLQEGGDRIVFQFLSKEKQIYSQHGDKGGKQREELKLWLDSFLAAKVPGVAQFLREKAEPKGCAKYHGKLVTFDLNSWWI